VLSIFSRLFAVGKLTEPLRAQLEPEGLVYVGEKVKVRKRFSGSVPGRHDALGVSRGIGLVVFTRQRLFALLPSAPRLKRPVIDQHWGSLQDGSARVAITESGVRLEIDLKQVDARFRGDLSLEFRMRLPQEVLRALPSRLLAFTVSSEYVFNMLGVRAR
jgi:hypothetical protein